MVVVTEVHERERDDPRRSAAAWMPPSSMTNDDDDDGRHRGAYGLGSERGKLKPVTTSWW